MRYLLIFILILLACADPEKEMPNLIKQLHGQDIATRNKAALRIGQIGPPHANKAVKVLINMLQDENPGIKSSAAYALRKIGTPEAKRALDHAVAGGN